MRDLIDFDNKKDREDFWIAITVILLFLAFPLVFTQCNRVTDLPEEVQEVIVPFAPKDTDQDGIPDKADKCPKVAGEVLYEGCPADTDGDGIYDVDDACPTKPGKLLDNGCPLDADGDGIYDKDDFCPHKPGPYANHGCPYDTDRDGVYDQHDICPYKAGPASNGGCPEVKLEEEERTILFEAMQNVEFVTGSAELKPTSLTVLSKVADLMNKYKKYKLTIEGHTDNTGDIALNKELSTDRAAACYEYLLKAGISADRMFYKGFGATRPLDSNDTPEGRKRNRRVQFDLHY